MPSKSRALSGAASAEIHRTTRICTSLSGRTCLELAEKAREALAKGTDLVEFRIDLLRPIITDEIRSKLSGFSGRSVLTVRPAAEGGRFDGKESQRLALIRRLAELRPAYFDVELRTLEAAPGLASERLGKNIIVSWHDLVRTPGRARLLSILSRAAPYGGLSKVVTTANSSTDNLNVLSLYDEPGPAPIAFCMGTDGLFSRVMAMERSSPIAYASLAGERTAQGQLPLNYMLAIRRRLGAD